MNPTGTIPVVKDTDGHIVWESNAILIYLADKHGWTDLYPTDLKQRSIINQYLHWHHRNSREVSVRIAAPNFRKDLQFPEGHVEQGKLIVANALQVLETGFLAQSKYIAGDALSLADFACFAEFGQMGPRFGNLIDFSPFPKVSAWMGMMEQVPFFEETHKVNSIIGDLRDGVKKETMGKANKESVEAIRTALAKL
eukprot:gnl/MRDRNA2_/MRDRNA2_195467_c0_seq1.p1 gnl/MRDRNA2_/MRDRNA2_195467_c0~~gnl/MRDRNA2_/MRDRNA2_195467_c0_seq1.p1  ORF type:complete len:217 (-),score=38.76 gnl/MRDRNA2_/MRDRNA2_195467_c0_seq1:357-944(-)